MPTPFMDRLGLRVPVVLAPMGGGPSTPKLVAAVSAAGGLGCLAGGYLAPDRLRAEIRAVRAATDASFGVNLFVPTPVTPDPDLLEATLARLEPYRLSLGLEPRPEPGPWAEDFDRQLEVVLDERVALFSFTFGALAAHTVDELHASGAVVMGTATNVAEAVALQGAGVDAVCAQGAEAGGHHGSWLAPAKDSVIGTMALVPLVVDAVDLPVVAAGGIADGRGVAAVLCLGADAAQMGTAFMLCPEAGTSVPHRRALEGVRETGVALTSHVTGRLARGVRNRLMAELEEVPVPGYPAMNWLTGELRRASAAAGIAEMMSLWCGQAAPLTRPQAAATLVASIRAEVERLLG